MRPKNRKHDLVNHEVLEDFFADRALIELALPTAGYWVISDDGRCPVHLYRYRKPRWGVRMAARFFFDMEWVDERKP